jgi:amino acid transporter
VGSARTIAFGTSIVILVKIGPARYPAAGLSPASSPNQRLTDITDAMIYGFTAFAGFEAPAALGEEARNSRSSVPASIVGIVVVTGIFYLLVVCAEAFAFGPRGVVGFTGKASPLGYLAGVGSLPVVLIYLTANIAVIRAFRTEFRDEFRLGPHLVIPAAATVVFLFPLWGILFRAPTR